MDDDDDDDINEEGREDPNPLCSDDDVSDDEPEKLFETENIVLCQYDKVKSNVFLNKKVKFVEFLRSLVRKINGDLI